MEKKKEAPTGMELKNYVRAKQISKLLLQGKSYTEIAKKLNISRVALYDVLDKQYVKDIILTELEKDWGKTDSIRVRLKAKTKLKIINRVKTRRVKVGGLINVSKLRRSRNAKIKRGGDSRYARIYHQKRRQKTHEFDLTLDYLIELAEKQNHRCALSRLMFFSGVPEDKHQKALQASLDRIDSDIGYIEGNVQWVTMWANTAKLHYTTEFFREMCKHVAE